MISEFPRKNEISVEEIESEKVDGAIPSARRCGEVSDTLQDSRTGRAVKG